MLKLSNSCIALLAGYLSIIGAFIIILAALYGIIKVLITLVTHNKKGLPSFHHLRIEIGNAIALGLELLVATDVLETLTKVLQTLMLTTLNSPCSHALTPSGNARV